MKEKRILVWDLPTRLFHWLLVVLVIAAIATAFRGGSMIVWHGLIGQLILGLLVFRVAWGVVGSTYARFHDLVPGLEDIVRYLRGDWAGIGHNPMGALVSLALIAVLLLQTGLGLFASDGIAFRGPFNALVSQASGEAITSLHRQNLWLIGLLVGLHLASILYLAIVRKENLVGPMITGRKRVADPSAKPATGGGRIPFALALFFTIVVIWMANGGPMTVLAPPPAPVVPAW